MALLQTARTKARHRGMSPWQLVQKIRVLDAALDETSCKVVELTTEVGELKAERTRMEGDFDQAAIDLSAALEDLALARTEIRQLEAAVELRDQQIEDLERKVDIGIKAEAAAARTQEIPVITPVPLHRAPMAATSPVHVPAWAVADEGVA